MEKPSRIEKFFDNSLTKGGFALISGVSSIPISALLPVLGDSLASERHRARVQSELERINEILHIHSNKIQNLTDHQYNLVSEIIITVLQNTETEKSKYLRNAVNSGLEMEDLSATESAQVSRAIRDLTAGELEFLARYFADTLLIGSMSNNEKNGAVPIDKSSNEMVYLSGLIGLGLVIPAGSTIGDSGRYVFAPICTKLRSLVDEDP